MGLAGPRTRRKLDYDPNNTRWSRDETTFGQKILRAHGWEPGKFLGAQNSLHSDLHTAASAAPIKINLKDDTMGLGAKPRQKQSNECTGLNGFQDLLGRLNGKSEDKIKEEQQVRSEIKTSLFVERRYGPMRFVSGGLLVGDNMKDLVSKSAGASVSETKIKKEETSSADEVEPEPVKKQKKEKNSKKRKAEEVETTDASELNREKKKKKKQKRSKEVDSPSDDSAAGEPKKKKKSKKSKEGVDEESEPPQAKKKKSKKSKDDSNQNPEASVVGDSLVPSEGAKKEKSKKSKKEKKRKQKAAQDSTEVSTETSTPALGVSQESDSSTPVATGTSTPQALGTRHHVRSRNIASKRLAMADMQALNQIFMVKPV